MEVDHGSMEGDRFFLFFLNLMFHFDNYRTILGRWVRYVYFKFNISSVEKGQKWDCFHVSYDCFFKDC